MSESQQRRQSGAGQDWPDYLVWAIEDLICHAISKRVEGNSTTYRLPNGATLIIPTGFANKEAKDD